MKHSTAVSLLVISLLSTLSIIAMESTEFNTLKETITQSLQAKVISPATFRDVTRDIRRIDEQATPAQQAIITDILTQHKPALEKTITNTLATTMTNAEVKKMAGAIAMATVYGVLPSIGFKALSILSGNLDLASAGTALIDVGVISALDSFVRYAEQKTGSSAEVKALQAGIISTAVQQYIGFSGERSNDLPFWGPMGRPVMAGLQNLSISLVMKELEKKGGVNTLLQKIDWNDIAQGPVNQAAITQHSGAYEFIRNNLRMIVQNQTVRNAVATTVTYAVEGAIVGAVMHSLGLGFYDEALPTAVAQSMMRGAMEGLYNFSQYGERHLGVTQRLTGGFTSLSVQRYMQSGVGIQALDMTPIAVQQVTSGAINGLVRQAGGWANTFKALYSTGKNALFGEN